ncbi:hypothetical protein AB9R12_01045 [Neisseria gonorrhoeae]
MKCPNGDVAGGRNHQCCRLPYFEIYSGLNLNRYGVASPCRTSCTVCGFVALS